MVKNIVVILGFRLFVEIVRISSSEMMMCLYRFAEISTEVSTLTS